MTEPPTLESLLAHEATIISCRPWPRAVVGTACWSALIDGLKGRRWTMLGLWGEPTMVHLALYEPARRSFALASFACPDGRYPSVGRVHPAALRLERTLVDLYGLVPEGLPDQRPWLDHGRWPRRRPLAPEPAAGGTPEPYPFLPVRGEGLHQIPVGPVHAGIIEPGHFRFTCAGETVVRLEERLGYVHKGIEGLIQGADLTTAAHLAGRVSGDSTVAGAYAFALAVEAALGLEVPPRAALLRGLMAELERLANHFGDFGAICNDAAFALMLAHCGVLREWVLRAAAVCFGHRLMMDRIVPGGVGVDPAPEVLQAVRGLVAEIRRVFPGLIQLYDSTTSLQDRTVGTGTVSNDLVASFGAGGFVGRAGGRHFDAREQAPYAPYPALSFLVPLRNESDVNARVWIRIREIEESVKLLDQILARLEPGPVRVAVEEGVSLAAGQEGIGLVEAFRGDFLVWLRMGADGRIERCHLRDPSWFQWPLLEAAIEDNIVADFPLCNKSFNCSYSGHDL
jgi:Ni,Fe-hydrogenase III large subunit